MGVGSIEFWFGRLWNRQICKLTAGAALIVAGVTGQPAAAAPQAGNAGGAVFVGDVDMAAESAASNANLPSLAGPKASPARAGGDARYVQQAVVRSSRPGAANVGAGPVSRADFAEAASARIQQQRTSKDQGAKQQRGLFARLMPSFGRQNIKPSRTANSRTADGRTAAQRPGASVTQRSANPQGVEQAAYHTSSQRGQLQLRAGGRTQPQGLFSLGRKQPQTRQRQTAQRQPKRLAKPPRTSVAQQRSQPGASQAGIRRTGQTPRGKVTVASAERSTRLPKPFTAPQSVAPVEASPQGMVFISDDSNKPTARTNASGRRIVRAVDAAPKAKPQATAKTDVQPGRQANYPTAKPSANRRGLNPVPPKSTQSAPSKRAVALLFEANQAAQSASTEQHFTRVVQRCRHVLAIDNSADAIRYSRQLASWALNKRGELRADAGQEAEAMTDFADALAMDASRWRAIHNRAVLMAQAGQYAEAFDAFNETIELNPKFAKAYSNRASLYVLVSDFRSAMVDYTKAISLDPDLAVAHKGQGRVCHMLGRMEQALQHLEAAALLAPEDASIATCRADLLVDMGRYAAATEGYRQAIATDAKHAGAYRNLAWLQATCPDRRFQNAEQAVANANKAIELGDAEDDISLDTLAAAQAAGGDFPAAIATVKKALAVAAQDDQPVYSERLSLYEAGQPFYSSPVAKVSQAGYERNAK